MLSGIALACGQQCNPEVEYLREPFAKHLSAYVLASSLFWRSPLVSLQKPQFLKHKSVAPATFCGSRESFFGSKKSLVKNQNIESSPFQVH